MICSNTNSSTCADNKPFLERNWHVQWIFYYHKLCSFDVQADRNEFGSKSIGNRDVCLSGVWHIHCIATYRPLRSQNASVNFHGWWFCSSSGNWTIRISRQTRFRFEFVKHITGYQHFVVRIHLCHWNYTGTIRYGFRSSSTEGMYYFRFRRFHIINYEILQIKRVGATLYTCMFFIFSFIMLKIFPTLLFALEVDGIMFLFGCVLASGFIFTLLVVRETKGINLEVLENKGDNKI